MTCIYPVSELGEFKDEVSKEPQDFAFVLRMKIAAEHKRKDGIRGLKVSGCWKGIHVPVGSAFMSLYW